MRERHVKYAGQTYVVRWNEDGPYVIYLRKVYAPGKPWERIYNSPFWNLKSHGMPKRGKVPAILSATARK